MERRATASYRWSWMTTTQTQSPQQEALPPALMTEKDTTNRSRGRDHLLPRSVMSGSVSITCLSTVLHMYMCQDVPYTLARLAICYSLATSHWIE